MSESQKAGEGHLEGLKNGDRCPAPRAKNLRRRSSIQKIIHMCNQSYQVFPHVFLWVQIHFHWTSFRADVWKILPVAKSLLALKCGVYLSIALLSAELAYCLAATLTLLLPSESAFFFVCIGILCVIALEIFDVAFQIRKKLRGSFFVKRKKVN